MSTLENLTQFLSATRSHCLVLKKPLQAVQAAVWFSSFDLAQGYLQMAMEEEDIEKTAFRAGSSGLY